MSGGRLSAVAIAALLACAPTSALAAPLQRDSAGRFLAPVEINGSGPYNLVLDTGANRTAVTPEVANALGLTHGPSEEVLSVSGALQAPLVDLAHLDAGAFQARGAQAVVLSGHVVEGADGVIGMDALQGKRLIINIARNTFEIEPGGAPAPEGYQVIAGVLRFGHLLEIPARVGDLNVRAIIDTGAEATLANMALIAAANGRRVGEHAVVNGAAGDMHAAQAYSFRNARFGTMALDTLVVHGADLPAVFDENGAETPALHLGMDIWRGATIVAIDFARAELQVLIARM